MSAPVRAPVRAKAPRGEARVLRPLPPAIAAMALLLAVKGVALVRPGGGGTEPSALALAGAAMVPAAYASSSPAPAAAPASAAVAKPPAPPVPAAPAEPAVSDAERAVLQDLRARRATLDAREQAAAAREAVLAAAEKRLAARVEEMAALQARLEALETARRDRGEANWRGLVRTYETMRPRDAAAILNEMEMPVLLEVLDRMKESKAAPVLAAMPPERARAATTQLAQMRTRANTPADPGTAPTPGPVLTPVPAAAAVPTAAAAPRAPGR